MKLVGAIETGGTKTVCAIVTADGELLARTQFPTEMPEQTLGKVLNFLRAEANHHGPLAGIGVGSFGPIDLRRSSTHYGRILNTPKPGGAGTDIPHEVEKFFDVPVVIDTDVNCALIGEMNWGAGRGLNDLVYITVGTGIGGGILSNGHLVKGQSHPDLGHMFIPTHHGDEGFVGACPFHQSRCAEGLASGPAMTKRWRVKCDDLDADHPAWDLEAQYIAVLCINVMLSTAPQKMILGGGVMQHALLIERVRDRLESCLNGYIDLSHWSESLDDFIVPAALGGDSGVLGASAIVAALT